MIKQGKKLTLMQMHCRKNREMNFQWWAFGANRVPPHLWKQLFSSSFSSHSVNIVSVPTLIIEVYCAPGRVCIVCICSSHQSSRAAIKCFVRLFDIIPWTERIRSRSKLGVWWSNFCLVFSKVIIFDGCLFYLREHLYNRPLPALPSNHIK